MLRLFCFVLLTLSVGVAHAADLYIRSFGEASNPAVIFLHGGPGYNSALFEGTTAKALADSGYFVIVYDRRGEGRSKDSSARFTFAEASSDLEQIYQRFHLAKAALIGHSFGGEIGIKFAAAHQKQVSALILVSAPISIQASLRNILDRSQKIYEQKGDSVNLRYIRMLRTMDTASLMYTSYSLGHAMQNGFYSPRERSEESKAIYTAYRADTVLAPYASKMDFLAVKGFAEHEHYTTLDLRGDLSALIKHGLPVYGIYGREDGLYSEAEVEELGKQLGEKRFRYIAGSSHNVFLDQQSAFIRAIREWVR